MVEVRADDEVDVLRLGSRPRRGARGRHIEMVEKTDRVGPVITRARTHHTAIHRRRTPNFGRPDRIDPAHPGNRAPASDDALRPAPGPGRNSRRYRKCAAPQPASSTSPIVRTLIASASSKTGRACRPPIRAGPVMVTGRGHRSASYIAAGPSRAHRPWFTGSRRWRCRERAWASRCFRLAGVATASRHRSRLYRMAARNCAHRSNRRPTDARSPYASARLAWRSS